MSKVIFSSWSGKIVDNRYIPAKEYTNIEGLNLPMESNGLQVKAFMSWNGLVVTDDRVDIVGMTHAYLKEAQKLSCGECSVGYFGIKIMLGIIDGIIGKKGSKGDIEQLLLLGAGIKENARCEFCPSAITPVLDSLKYYKDDYFKLISGSRRKAKSTFVTRVTAPCMEACPAHQDVPGYIELIRNRRYKEALELIGKTNCLPQMTGRACVAFCEAKCTRNDIDSPLAIRSLKRFAAEHGTEKISAPAMGKTGDKQKVAIIGAGPAGLSAGYNLALMGYKVTIFDEQAAEGGMALVGIPSYRLPKNVLAGETNTIKRLGVEIRLNTRFGKDITLNQLSSQGFEATFIATGAHLGRKYDIENWNEKYAGLIDGVKLLHDVSLGKKIKAQNRVVIVGGGNVAIDCARTCLRLGFKEVTIVYRRSRTEMPGSKEEIEAAEKEGVNIRFLTNPVKVLSEGDKVTGAQCVRMELGEPDASGRRRPIVVKGSEFVLPADVIIPAVGESPDLSFISKEKIETTNDGTVKVDSFCRTSREGVFSGGDCAIGPATLIEAIAAGNRAARGIDQYLTSGKVVQSEENTAEIITHALGLSPQKVKDIIARKSRQSSEQLPPSDRVRNFDEVEKCFSAEAAVKEAERCLRCYRVMLLALANEG